MYCTRHNSIILFRETITLITFSLSKLAFDVQVDYFCTFVTERRLDKPPKAGNTACHLKPLPCSGLKEGRRSEISLFISLFWPVTFPRFYANSSFLRLTWATSSWETSFNSLMTLFKSGSFLEKCQCCWRCINNRNEQAKLDMLTAADSQPIEASRIPDPSALSPTAAAWDTRSSSIRAFKVASLTVIFDTPAFGVTMANSVHLYSSAERGSPFIGLNWYRLSSPPCSLPFKDSRRLVNFSELVSLNVLSCSEDSHTNQQSQRTGIEKWPGPAHEW